MSETIPLLKSLNRNLQDNESLLKRKSSRRVIPSTDAETESKAESDSEVSDSDTELSDEIDAKDNIVAGNFINIERPAMR